MTVMWYKKKPVNPDFGVLNKHLVFHRYTEYKNTNTQSIKKGKYMYLDE